MKIAAGRADAFAAQPDAGVCAVLVYGPDQGLVDERREALLRAVIGDGDDAFREARVTAADLIADPARLADEAAAIAFGGGRRVVVVDGGGERLAPVLKAFLKDPPGDALILVTAGNLGPRLALRRLFEDAKNAAALACYADEGAGLERLIAKILAAYGLRAGPDAMAYLSANLGSDRGVSRRELEKLAIYVGPGDGDGGGDIGIADAMAVIGDNAALSVDGVILAAADGDVGALDQGLARAFAEDVQPVQLLRAGARHFERLHQVAAMRARGMGAEGAVEALRPPVFFRDKPRLRRQAGLWPQQRVARALDILLEAEMDCKTTGLPDQAICARTLMRLAQSVRRR